jgi:hypothetical protein
MEADREVFVFLEPGARPLVHHAEEQRLVQGLGGAHALHGIGLKR